MMDKIGSLIVENGFVSNDDGTSSADLTQMVSSESPRHMTQVDYPSETNGATGTSSHRQF